MDLDSGCQERLSGTPLVLPLQIIRIHAVGGGISRPMESSVSERTVRKQRLVRLIPASAAEVPGFSRGCVCVSGERWCWTHDVMWNIRGKLSTHFETEQAQHKPNMILFTADRSDE